MNGPCDDLRVLDLSSGPAAGLATMVLADFGADVVKIERPGGDRTRSQAASPMWLRGKRSVVLDLAGPEGRAQLHGLARGADVVVASFQPGHAERLEVDAATLRASNPGLVYCSVTGWGPRGEFAHYPPYEHVVAAKTGRMQSFYGFPQRPAPYFSPVWAGCHAAAQSALSGILAALLVRERTGEGQVVETSLLQGMFPYDLNGLVRNQLARRFPEHFTAAAGPGGRNLLQYLPVLASDGRWIQFANLMEHLFHSMISAVGLSEIYADERFIHAPDTATPADSESLRRLILERVRERPAAEWMEAFAENGNVAAEPFTTTQAAMRHPDIVANGEVVELDDPRLGRVRQLGPLARLTATPAVLGRPAPAVGEHTAEVLAEPDRPAWRPTNNGRTPGAKGAAPLDGITVVEFATVIAVPLGASILGDLGARVIKVEPLTGDPYRGMGAGLPGYIGSSKTTASKESICIDLRNPEGQAIARKILVEADVLIHNYRPDVPARLGIGYDELRAINPRLVYIGCAGYGPDGPGRDRPAAHPIPGAVDGAALYQAGSAGAPAEPGSTEELMDASAWLYGANESSPDANTSVVVASAALLGLYARRRTGAGQRIVLSMLGANAYTNFDDFVSYEGKPARAAVDAAVLGFGPTYRLYPTASGWVFLGLLDEDAWQRFQAMAAPGLASDRRFATREDRDRNADALVAELTRVFSQRPADEWERLLIAADVACVQASQHTPGSFFESEQHMRDNGFVVEADHALWGRYQRWGPSVTFSATPGRYGPGVLAGEHTDRVLAGVGYSPAEIGRLRESKVVGSVEPMGLPVHV